MAPHKISWTEQTWNPLLGCTKVSPGCDGCYAIRQARMRASNPNPKIAEAFAGLVERNAVGELDWTGRVNLLPDRLEQPLHWRKPRRIFVPSESDLFHDQVPDEYIARVFAVMAATPQHTYQIPTKRHGRMRSLLKPDPQNLLEHLHTERAAQALYDAPWPLPNLWLGVSVEDQDTANLRIPALLETPAAVRWVSAEPLLGWVDMTSLERRPGGPLIDALAGDVKTRDGEIYAAAPGCIDWVVAGGESGPGARPMHPDWARSLRDQVKGAGRAFHFKQWGEWIGYANLGGPPDADSVRAGRSPWADREPDGWVHAGTGELVTEEASMAELGPFHGMYRVGKKAAGRLLDREVWDEYPQVSA